MYKKIQIFVLLSAISGLMLNATHMLAAATSTTDFNPNVEAMPGFFAKLSAAQQGMSARLPALPNMATITQALKKSPTLAAEVILENPYAVALGGYMMRNYLKTQAKSNEIKVFYTAVQKSIDIVKKFEPTFASIAIFGSAIQNRKDLEKEFRPTFTLADFNEVDELAKNLKPLDQLQKYYTNFPAIANQIGDVKNYLQGAANTKPALPEKTSLIEQTKTEANKALLFMTAHKLDTLYNFKLTNDILRILSV